MPFTNYQENVFLNYLFDNTVVYVAASTTTPTKVGGNVTEPTGNGYARITTSASDWTAAATGALTTADSIGHAEASGSWGTITYAVLYDAASGGNCLGYGVLASSKTIISGQILRYPADAFDVTFTQ